MMPVCCEGCKYWRYCRGQTLDPMVFCYEPEEDDNEWEENELGL